MTDLHPRAVITSAVMGLITPIVGDGNAYLRRTRPLAASEAPVALIYPVFEDSTRADLQRSRDRTLNVAVVFELSGPEEALDAPLDALCFAAERAFDADPRLGGLLMDSDLKSTALKKAADGDTVVGSAQMTWTLRYRTRATPATP